MSFLFMRKWLKKRGIEGEGKNKLVDNERNERG